MKTQIKDPNLIASTSLRPVKCKESLNVKIVGHDAFQKLSDYASHFAIFTNLNFVLWGSTRI